MAKKKKKKAVASNIEPTLYNVDAGSVLAGLKAQGVDVASLQAHLKTVNAKAVGSTGEARAKIKVEFDDAKVLLDLVRLLRSIERHQRQKSEEPKPTKKKKSAKKKPS